HVLGRGGVGGLCSLPRCSLSGGRRGQRRAYCAAVDRDGLERQSRGWQEVGPLLRRRRQASCATPGTLEAHVGGAARAQPLNASAQTLDGAALRRLGARLLGDELSVFPVRHHSPACAFHLSRLIRERPPSLVLIEGPRCFDPLIPLLTDE